MKLAHAADDCLAGLLVGLDGERRILFGEPTESTTQLVLIALGLWLDGDRDDRRRERHRLELDRSLHCCQRVAGPGVLESDGGDDVAGVDLVDVLLRRGVHPQQAAEALLLAVGGVDHGIALGGGARSRPGSR